MNGDFFICKFDNVMVPFRYSNGRLTVSGAGEGIAINKMKENYTENVQNLYTAQ